MATEQDTPELHEDDSVFLMTASDLMETEVVESKLSAYGIPVYRKYRETGAYLELFMGNTNFGIDLFIPEIFLEQAQDLTKEWSEAELIEEELQEEADSGVDPDVLDEMAALDGDDGDKPE